MQLSSFLLNIIQSTNKNVTGLCYDLSSNVDINWEELQFTANHNNDIMLDKAQVCGKY